jgi:hypothetical protein
MLTAIAVLAAAIAALLLLRPATGVPGWIERTPVATMTETSDSQVAHLFSRSDRDPDHVAYETLFRYLLEGFLAYRSPSGAYAFYPGEPSLNGRRIDGLEGYARFFPLVAAWVASGRSDTIELNGKTLSLIGVFKQGLIDGTNPNGPEYWGDIQDHDQRVVEAADIALALWICRDRLWVNLSTEEKEQVSRWLKRSLTVTASEGTWSTLPMVVHRALKALGVDVSRYDERVATLHMRLKGEHYRGEGWFFDPPNGFDFFNSWGIHYALFWLDQMDAGFDPAFVRQSQAQFSSFFVHLFGPKGPPMMGRGICYRMAAPAALLTASAVAPDAVSKGTAMRALDTTWGFFLSHGALRNGTVTQGLCGADLSVIDNFSGAATCLWAVRGLTLAFYLDKQFAVLDSLRERLPVEKGDFEVSNSVSQWKVTGRGQTGDIVLTIVGNPEGAAPPVVPHGLIAKAKEALYQKPFRPNNQLALQGRRFYSTSDQIVPCLPVK